MEYRLEMIHFSEKEGRSTSHGIYLVKCLNEFAEQGWRVVSIDLSPHPSFATGPLPVLLVRSKPEHS